MSLDYLNQRFDPLTSEVISARFTGEAKAATEKYFETNGRTLEAAEALIGSLLEALNDAALIISYPAFPQYEIPYEILANNLKIRQKVIWMLNELLASIETGDPAQMTLDFFAREHEFIKWALNQWLLASPGMTLEIMKFPSNFAPIYTKWLDDEYGILPGDEVIHRHVISGNGRSKLIQNGFKVPDMHWVESYYRQGMIMAQKIAATSESCKGIVGRGSWIYNPRNFVKASDGKPFAAFTFLKDDSLTGHRLIIGAATPDDKDLNDQLNFATRDSRRKALYDAGEFLPMVYGVVYPREELLAQNFQKEA